MTAQTTETATIDAGTVDGAIEIVFRKTDDPTDDRIYLLQAHPRENRYLDALERFPRHQVKIATDYYIDDFGGDWYAVANVDCFDPPMAIVRARSFEAALECFCDEFADWIAVDPSSARDYPENDREYNGSGVHIDSSAVYLEPLILVSVRTR